MHKEQQHELTCPSSPTFFAFSIRLCCTEYCTFLLLANPKPVGVQATEHSRATTDPDLMLASSLFNFPTITCSVHGRLPFYWCHFRTRKLSCRLRLRLRSTLASGTHAVAVLGVMLSLQSASTATPSSIHQLNPSLTTRLVSSPTSGPLAYRNACNASQKSPDDDNLAWAWIDMDMDMDVSYC